MGVARLLIRLRLKTAIRTITHARPQQAWQYAFAALAGGGIFAFIFLVRITEWG